MKLIYENDRGKVVMHGGGGDGFNIIDIKGLSIPDSDIDSVYYPNIAGRTVENVTPLERAITISGDVCDKTNQKISSAISIFSNNGTMTIYSNGTTRKISARCINFEPDKRKGMYIPFVAQFVADDPYFTDVNDTETGVYKKEKKLKRAFILPCVFSTRRAEADIVNDGDSMILPVFEISSLEGAVCPEGIIIENLRNGNRIKLNTGVSAGEVITVDTKNCKITSNQRNNIISCLDNETSISNFGIDLGVSTIKITTENISGSISALCIHNNRYIYAVI